MTAKPTLAVFPLPAAQTSEKSYSFWAPISPSLVSSTKEGHMFSLSSSCNSPRLLRCWLGRYFWAIERAPTASFPHISRVIEPLSACNRVPTSESLSFQNNPVGVVRGQISSYLFPSLQHLSLQVQNFFFFALDLSLKALRILFRGVDGHRRGIWRGCVSHDFCLSSNNVFKNTLRKSGRRETWNNR